MDEFYQDRKREYPQKFSGLEIAVLHIALDKPLHLVLQRFSAGLGCVIAHLHTSIKMGDTAPDASLCVALNDDSDDK